MRRAAVGIVSITVLGGPAAAVAQQQQQQQPPANGQQEQQQQEPQRPLQDRLDARLQQTGGQPANPPAPGRRSLFKAAIAAQNDPRQAKVGDVSFFAVPAPEPKTLKKHDQVTIIIREECTFSSDGSAES